MGDLGAAIFIILAIGSAIVNFFKEQRAQAAVEERQRRGKDEGKEPQTEIESFLDEIGASQPSADINERRQQQIQERQERQREELRKRQQQRRMELQEEQRNRQTEQTRQQSNPTALPLQQRSPQQRSPQERRPQDRPNQGAKIVLSDDDIFIEENHDFDRVGDRHVQSAVEQRHVKSSLLTRHVPSAVEDSHVLGVSSNSSLLSQQKKADSLIVKLLADKTLVRKAIIVNEVMSRPKSRR